jgi:hypothetical protein
MFRKAAKRDGKMKNTRRYPYVPEIPVLYLNDLPKFLFNPFDVVPFCIDTAIPAGCP